MKTSSEQIHLEAIVPNNMAGMRLDQALALLFSHHSRSRLQTWVRSAQVKVNGNVKRPRDKVLGGEQIIIDATLAAQEVWGAENIPLQIIHEDETLLIINKPPGLVVHPAAGNFEGTLVNALLHHQPSLATLPRAGIVHRLDKDTSGLLVVAKTLSAHTHLVKQLQQRTIKREYEALVQGIITAGGTINAPISRHPIHRKRMAVVETGKTAITHYRVMERFHYHTRIKVFLETGRTHQIRVHMAHIHHPLFGDSTYGGRLRLPPNASDELIESMRGFKRQALHALSLGLIHPANEQYQEWSAPLPTDMQKLLEIFRKNQLQ